MKKYMALLLALVMVLSVFAIPAYAAENDGSTYTPTCPSCNARLATTGYQYVEEYTVPGCSVSNDHHVHYNRVYERTWYCRTASCELVGYVVDSQKTVVEENVCYLVTPIE